LAETEKSIFQNFIFRFQNGSICRSPPEFLPQRKRRCDDSFYIPILDLGRKQMLNVPKLFRFLLTISAVAVAMLGLTPVAQAQGADEAIEEIITTGTRRT
jgi:hypothetical protein